MNHRTIPLQQFVRGQPPRRQVRRQRLGGRSRRDVHRFLAPENQDIPHSLLQLAKIPGPRLTFA